MLDFVAIQAYLESGQYPEDYDKAQKRSLRRQATESFAMYAGVLHHRSRQGILCRVVLGVEEQKFEMQRVHGEMGASFHYGQTATLEKILER